MVLKVTRRDSGRNQERMLWLFNDILVYAKRNPRKKDKFFCSCILPVRHCFVERPPGKTYFYLHCKGETTVLLAQTYGELDDWCIKLQSTIDEARVNRATLRKDSSCRLPLHRSFLSRLPRRRSSLGLRLKRKLEESAASSQAESDLAMSDSRQSGSGLLTAAAHRFFGLFRRKRSRADESAGFSQTEPYSKRSRLAVFQRPLSTVTEEDSDDGVFESPMNRMSVDMERDGPPIAINSSTPMRRKNTSSPPWWKKETNMKTTTTSKRHRFCSMM
uniref:PH domain-containing protein n=1 Tax=Plectus sambesii TaxID=2011161 RepID=A0A914VSG7_9BILA